MSAGLDVKELAEFLGIDEVSIDAHTEAERGVHFEGSAEFPNGQQGSIVLSTIKGLRLGSVTLSRVS